MTQLDEIKEMLIDMKDDSSASKNIKIKIDSMLSIIEEDKEDILKVVEMIDILEVLCEDINIPGFIRTQLWNILTALETKSVELNK